jgi:hypothetical protein
MSARVPAISAAVKYLGQTTAISSTTIFTPLRDVFFRVTIFIHFESGSASPVVSFTDDHGNAKAVGVGINTIRAKASEPIQLAVTVDASSNVDVFVLLESLD